MAQYKHKIKIEDGEYSIEFECVTSRYHYSVDGVDILGRDLYRLGFDYNNRITAKGNWDIGVVDSVYGESGYLSVYTNDAISRVNLSAEATLTDDTTLLNDPLDTTLEMNMRRLFDVKDKFKKRAVKNNLEITDSTPFIDYPDIIIPESSGGSGGTDVVFYDYDGTAIYSYSLAEIQEMTELPTPPSHEDDDLVFDGWNWNLEDIKAEGKPTNVGALYRTIDDCTYITISLTSYLTIDVIIKMLQNGVASVDWGDDSTTEITGTGNITFNHTYSSIGEYTIKIYSSVDYNFLTGYNKFFGYASINSPQYFYYGVKKVRFSSRMKTIHSELFYKCYALEEITITSECIVDGQSVFGDCYSLKNVVIPKGNTEIGTMFFSNCYSLKNVILPPTTKTLNNYSFQYCYSLISFTIPKSVTLSSGVFRYCTSLEKVTMPMCQYVYSELFSNCYNLKEVVIDEKNKLISTNAFEKCYTLSKVDFTNSKITSISNYGFRYCYGLKNIEIPEGVTTISQQSFAYCYSLFRIKFPSTLNTIQSSSFIACYSLLIVDLTELSTPPTLQENATSTFMNNGTNLRTKFLIKSGTLSAYQSDSKWSSVCNLGLVIEV